MTTYKTLKEQAIANKNSYLQYEFKVRIYPVSNEGLKWFDKKGTKDIYAFYDHFLNDKPQDNTVYENIGVLPNYLKLYQDYDMEIVEVVHHEYKEGLQWNDIKEAK